MSKNTPPTITEKIQTLEALVDWFESDKFALEQATDKFREADQLASEIQTDLAELKNEVVVLKQKFDQAG